MADPTTAAPVRRTGGRPALDGRRSVVAGSMVGIGLMAALDEIVFHQVLAWHHLYDGSTSKVALFSDGVLHAIQLVLLVAGWVLAIRLALRGTLALRSAAAGVLIGSGGFQLFDGTVNHKVLDLHEIRYGVDTLPYDIAWNAAALLVLAAGIVLARRFRGR